MTTTSEPESKPKPVLIKDLEWDGTRDNHWDRAYVAFGVILFRAKDENPYGPFFLRVVREGAPEDHPALEDHPGLDALEAQCLINYYLGATPCETIASE